jgi:hypothetical protein
VRGSFDLDGISILPVPTNLGEILFYRNKEQVSIIFFSLKMLEA